MKGYTSVVNVLLASGADVNIKNIQGFTAIMMAAGQGYVEIFQSLMRYEADINAKSDSGQTALKLAKSGLAKSGSEGHFIIVQWLEQASEAQ